MNLGGEEREGDTESAAGSRLQDVSTEPDAGLEPTDCEIMTRAEVGRSTDRATQAPPHVLFLTFIYFQETDRGRVGEGQRERETQNRKQAPGSEPSAQSLTRGSNPRTARS